MPFLGPNWEFDITSFIVGVVVTTIIFLTIYLLRTPAAALRSGMADRLGQTRQRLTMGSEARYREDLIAALQKHHLAGSLISLEDILIQPRFILEEPPPNPDDEEAFEPDITYVVPVSPDYPDLAALFQAPSRSLLDLARSAGSLVIIGRQGSGRTTALAMLTIYAARLEPEYFSRAITPIFLHAGNLNLAGSKNRAAADVLFEAAAETLPNFSIGMPTRNLTRALKNKTALVILDGWDDLPETAHAGVVGWLRSFRDDFPGVRVIAAGPLQGYGPFQELGLTPVIQGGWTDDDYHQMVHRWVAIWETLLAARKLPKDDIDPAMVAGWISGGTAGRLPYDITLKIWGGLAGDIEGPRPVDWFASYLNRMGIGGEVALGLEAAAVELLQSGSAGLGRAAYVKHINAAVPYALNVSRQDPTDAVEQLARPGGLLARRAGKTFAPAHPQTLGFLAARAITGHTAPDVLVQNLADPYWRVALQPFAALDDATPIVSQLLNGSIDVLQMGLMTCASWLADAPSNANWRNEALGRLAQLVMSADASPVLRGRALSAMIRAHDDHINQFLRQGLTSEDPLARQYVAIGLGASRDASAVSELAILMDDSDLYVRWAAALALVLIGNLPALESLGTKLLEGDEHQRIAVGKVLAMHPSEGHPMLRDAIEDQDTIVRRAAVLGLRRIGPEKWVLDLLEDSFLNDPEWIVKNAAEDASQYLKANAPREVTPTPTPAELNWLVSWAAKQGSSVPSDPQGGLQMLLRALSEGEELVQAAAADYLGRLGNDTVKGELTKAASSSSPHVREAAQKALAALAWAKAAAFSN